MTDSNPIDPIYQLAAVPASTPTGLILLAGRGSGLYRSEDGGQTWQPALGSLGLAGPLPVVSLGISPQYPNNPTILAGFPGGLLRSTDHGMDWKALGFTPPPPYPTAIVFSPDYSQDGVIIIGTAEDGILRSENGGEAWSGWNFGLMDLEVLCLAISPQFKADETLYAGTGSGLFRSANGGRAWRELDLPGGHAPVTSLAVSPGFGTDRTLFAGLEEGGLLRSTDGGETWTPLAAQIITDPLNQVILSAAYPARPELAVLHGGQMLVSGDGGSSWRTLPTSGSSQVSAALAPSGFEAGGLVWLGLDDGRILRYALEGSDQDTF
jgi:hypothetical protein